MNAILSIVRRLVRILYRFRGGQRVADAARRFFARRSREVLVSDFDGDLRFLCSLDEHMGSQIFWRGYYSEDQLIVLDRILKPEMHFIDVGANQGEFTLFAAKRLSGGRVSSFEPSPVLHARLERNVRLNAFPNIRLFDCGLGAVPGQARLFALRDRYTDGTRHDGVLTIYRSRERCIDAGTVRITTLDSVVLKEGLRRIDVLKIDVEGSELDVLKGATTVIDKDKPAIIIEVSEETCSEAGYSPIDIREFLESRGYVLYIIKTKGTITPLRDSSLGRFQNLLCVRKDGNAGGIL